MATTRMFSLGQSKTANAILSSIRRSKMADSMNTRSCFTTGIITSSDFQCSIDYRRDNTSNGNRPAGALLTPKAFDNKAQGRSARGAPWVRNERAATNPTGVVHASSGMNPRHAAHCPRDMAIQIVGPRWGPAHLLAMDPGCTAFAATWALLLNRFTVINTCASPSRPPLRPRVQLCCSVTAEPIGWSRQYSAY